MRLSNTTFVVLAVAFLASGTAVSKADQTIVSNVDVVHSSHVLAGEDNRFLRSHQTTEDKLPDYDEEERKYGANLFAKFKLDKMENNHWYRYNVFRRWKIYHYSTADVNGKSAVSDNLKALYTTFRQKHG